MATWAVPDGDGTLMEVWVVPGASRDTVDGPHGAALKVRVAAPPERGRANDAVAALLEDRLGAPVVLVAGPAGRRKKLRVAGLTPAEVATRLVPDPPGAPR